MDFSKELIKMVLKYVTLTIITTTMVAVMAKIKFRTILKVVAWMQEIAEIT